MSRKLQANLAMISNFLTWAFAAEAALKVTLPICATPRFYKFLELLR
jgi:hypothetical protein